MNGHSHRRIQLIASATAAMIACAAPHLALGGVTCADSRSGPLQNSQANNGTDGSVHALGVWDPDGAGPLQPRLVAGGSFTSIQGTAARNVASLNPATGQWEPFGSPLFAPFNDCRALGVWNDQLVSGWGTQYPNGNTGGMRRWNGSGWTLMESGFCNPSFTNMTPDFVRCFGYYNGAFYAGGGFTGWGDGMDPRYGCEGQYGWGVSVWDGVSHWRRNVDSFWAESSVLAMQAWNGFLVLGGEFSFGQCSCNPGNRIAAWNGSTWNTLNGGTPGVVRALTIYNGDLIAAGDFTQMGFGTTVNAAHVARWNGSAWTQVGLGLNGNVRALINYNGLLIAAGDFTGTASGGVIANHIAVWNGSFWTGLGSGIDAPVDCLTVYDGKLIAGGDFTNAGGIPAFDIARWDGTQWSSFGGGSATAVLAFTTLGSRLIVGGDFHQSAAIGQTANEIVTWDGVAMRPLGSGMNSSVNALTSFENFPPSNTIELIAGGQFTSAGGVAANHVARWVEDTFVAFPPPAWQAMGQGLDNTVTSLTRFNFSTVAGGYFTNSGATSVICVARYNTTSGAWGPMNSLGNTLNGPVLAMRVYSPTVLTTRLVAGGLFTSAGPANTSYVASWTENTQTTNPNVTWQPMGSGFNSTVYALEYYNGSMYAAGAFTASGATALGRIARYTGSAWVPINAGSGFNGTVSALRSSNGYLYAAGAFTSVDGITARRMARWNGVAWEEVLGGADDQMFALASYHNEVHAGGWFNSVKAGAVASKSWGRYLETGAPWIAYDVSPSINVTCHAAFAPSITLASGYSNVTYQWRKNSVPLVDGYTGTGSTISGATGNLVIVHPSSADEGIYDCVVSNPCGSATSGGCTLTVTAPCQPCPYDLAPGDGDGAVNVSDLLAIILQWGPCPAPCQPRCRADISPEVGGDCQINVNDLLAVLTHWGACP